MAVRQDGSAWITIDRPDKHNALARTVLQQLADAVNRLGADLVMLYPMQVALQRGATLGENSASLLEVFGRYRPGS
mgnify:CR=1 FL=1